MYDTVIIGSGPGGLTAAIYTVRADLKTLVIAGKEAGGQLVITTLVENWPGFPEGIHGPELMKNMQKQVSNLGGEIRQGEVEKVEKINEGFGVVLTGGERVEAKSVIVATGAGARWLGLPNEKELIGKGVSGCATCDGMFYRDKVVAMVGGGDTAVQEAHFLTKFVQKVYLIHRRDELRASVAEQKKILNNAKIEMVWNSEVKELIEREGRLGSIRVENNKTGEEKTMEIGGLFVAIGRVPATKFLEGLVEMNENGFVKTRTNEKYPTMTSVTGIFVAGDCSDSVYKQAIVAAGEGCKAGLEVEKWLESRN
ncbi:thioredoxin-disulfide reductase [Patescibacteria group bacterium]|nr:thioredoxin-disulfide reductase [Patescibacteria group bacterium]